MRWRWLSAVRRPRALLGAALAVLLATGLMAGLLTGVVGAQSPSGTPAAAATATAATGISGSPAYQAFVTALAKNLGLDPAKVDQALKQTLGQEVAQGQTFPPFGPAAGQAIGPSLRVCRSVRRGPAVCRTIGGAGQVALGPAAGALATAETALASFFGESAASLRAELAQGLSLAQIAQRHGKTTAQLKTFLTQQFQAHLDQLINGHLVGAGAGTSGAVTTPGTAVPVPTAPAVATPAM